MSPGNYTPDFQSDEFREAAACAGFESVEEAERAVRAVLSNATHELLETLSDPDLPQAVVALALLLEATIGCQVKWIKQEPTFRTEPAGEIPDGDRLRWALARLTGDLRPDDPKPRKVDYQAWFFGLVGNPMEAESWLCCQGYRASNCAPTVVEVCAVGLEGSPDPDYAREYRDGLDQFNAR